MKKNIGKFDRMSRLFIGALCLLIALLATFSWLGRVIIALIGLFSIYEAFAGWCAFYALIGKNTCPIDYK